MKTVYLAGPITGLTYGEAEDGWRTDAALYLTALGVSPLSPLRGTQYLRDIGKLEKQYLNGSPLSSPQGIVRRDFNDVKNCDAILANFLDANRASVGTCWEMGAAYALQKPVVAVLAPKSIHDHAFITQTAAYTFDNLEDALGALAYLLGVSR
jgi:nucleoside 2-deoxyribosyltransferase